MEYEDILCRVRNIRADCWLLTRVCEVLGSNILLDWRLTTWGISWYASNSPDSGRLNSLVRRWHLPSKSFVIHGSFTAHTIRLCVFCRGCRSLIFVFLSMYQSLGSSPSWFCTINSYVSVVSWGTTLQAASSRVRLSILSLIFFQLA
jgi:hypothetical protein